MPLTPKQERIIQNSLKKTEAWWRQFHKRVEYDILHSKGYDDFLERTKEYTTDNILNELSTTIAKDVLNSVNFNKLKRRALTRQTINNNVADLVTAVGDDLKYEIRAMVKKGYDLGYHPNKIAELVNSRNLEALYIIPEYKTFTESEWNNLPQEEQLKYTLEPGFKRMSPEQRSKTIARTEVSRTQNIVNYLEAQQDGAIGFTVVCRPDCCEYCAEVYADITGDDYRDLIDSPRKKLIGGNVKFNMSDTDKLPPYHPNSYDKDTQIFTEHGWKYIAELTGNEKILSLNPDNDSLEFIKPVRLFKHKEPKLVHMYNKWFDVCVTPDHDCFVHKRKDGGKKGRYFEPQFRKPSELNSECRFVRCIDTDRESPEVININGLEFKPSDFAFFMAWYISEGSVLHNRETAKKHGYPVKISQQIKENREVLERELKRMFGYLGFRVAIGKNYFEVYSKQLYDYLVPLGYSHEKYIPKEVFTLDKECLNIFLDNYVLGDGHERICNNDMVKNSSHRILYTSSKRLKDDLSYLILLCGFYPSININNRKGTVVKHRNGSYSTNHDVYGISINRSKYALYSSLTVERVDYDDYTYCVELPKWHTLWVMRNGKTSWNGNCRCSANFFYK